MTVPSATVRIAADQNHLAWDPAIAPVAGVGSGDVAEFSATLRLAGGGSAILR